MIEIPVAWLSFCPDNPARGRWDQAFTARLLAGEEWTPPGGYRFVDAPLDPTDGRGRVIVFPCGHYAEHGEEHIARRSLLAYVDQLEWAIVIATSDECQTFRWDLIDPWPDHVQLWVMLPRPERAYPVGTRFIGEGSPRSAREIAHHGDGIERDLDLFFSGQGGHDRRSQAFAGMRRPLPFDIKRRINRTGGFTKGMEPDDYYAMLRRTWFAPAPAGICSQSSFRAYEAFEAGAIPILDGLRPGDEGVGFWAMLGLDKVTTIVDDWRDLSPVIASQHPRRVEVAGHVSSRWQQYKRRLSHQLHDAVEYAFDTRGPRRYPEADDTITVIVPTSPVPSNPDLSIIFETIASIRERLPRAEILITCDGVRDEQVDREAAYHEFVRRLCSWTNQQHNICPITFTEHQHQSGMMRRVLDEVTTPYLLYVEHDCPLEGVIPFGPLTVSMAMYGLASMRLFHETAVQPGSEHLFLGRYIPPADTGHAPFARTLQWSQRPHLAETAWYRNIMSSYFGSESRTMIEDVMHGVVQHGLLTWRDGITDKQADTWRIRAGEVWNQWRMAVYAPEGSWKRSGHLDARGEDPKFPMLISYDDGRPDGAPPEGLL